MAGPTSAMNGILADAAKFECVAEISGRAHYVASERATWWNRALGVTATLGTGAVGTSIHQHTGESAGPPAKGHIIAARPMAELGESGSSDPDDPAHGRPPSPPAPNIWLRRTCGLSSVLMIEVPTAPVASVAVTPSARFHHVARSTHVMRAPADLATHSEFCRIRPGSHSLRCRPALPLLDAYPLGDRYRGSAAVLGRAHVTAARRLKAGRSHSPVVSTSRRPGHRVPRCR